MRPLAFLLLAIASVCAGEAKGPYAADQGPHKVGRIDLVKLGDLQLRITYPQGKQRSPVILFSHGLWGSRRGYTPLTSYWASYGYVCIQPDHPDSRLLGRMPRAQATRGWSKRPRQIKRILDSFEAIEKSAPKLKGRLDQTRVGVGGHSFGAHTSQLIAGVKPVFGKQDFQDDRVKAILLLSPQGEGGLFGRDSWKNVRKPVLVVTGSEDRSPLEQDKGPQWRLAAYNHLPAGDKYLVFVDGMQHGFGGISGTNWRGAGRKNEDQVRITQQTALAFFDAYVKGDKKARVWLESGAPKSVYGLKVRFERK